MDKNNQDLLSNYEDLFKKLKVNNNSKKDISRYKICTSFVPSHNIYNIYGSNKPINYRNNKPINT